MATLTWQDVAGQVRAPDLNGSALLITRGIDQLAAAAQEPERIRQAQMAKEMMAGELQSRSAERLGETIDRIDTKQKNAVKEQDMKEFGAVQSFLETGARQAALQGIPLEKFLAGSPEFNSLDAGARGFIGSNLSDAYMRGDETRMTQAERAADNARQDAQNRQSQSNFERQFSASQQDRKDAKKEREDARKAANYGKPRVWATGNDKTDQAMIEYGNRTGSKFIEASGAAYETQTVTDVAKSYGTNLGAATDVFNKVNAQRRKDNKPELPLNVFKRVLDTGIGTSTEFDGWNDVDDKAISSLLTTAGDQFDDAYKAKDFYDQVSARVDSGETTDIQKMDKAWNKMFPVKKEKDVPVSRQLEWNAPPRAGRE